MNRKTNTVAPAGLIDLAHPFSVHPSDPWVAKHNAEVRGVLAAYHADRPVRVPLLSNEWYGQHGLYAHLTGLDYRDYYRDLQTMVRVQLAAARLRRELPICDMVLGEPPESWPVSVDLWPVPTPGWLGCSVLFRAGSVPAAKPLNLSREAADAMEMPDPTIGGILRTMGVYWSEMKQLCRGMAFLGRPIGPVNHGVAAYGLFAHSMEIRGAGLLTDMYEAPAFVRRFLRKVASWIVALESTWNLLGGGDGSAGFGLSDHGIDMLSPHIYEEFIVPVIREMKVRLGAPLSGGLHHCGRGIHLFPIIHRHFGLKSVDTLTVPLLDVARVRRELGPDVWITAMIADWVVRQGPAEAIREAVREAMRAKGRGRFAMMLGDMLPGTPLDHYRVLYEAVKEFGGY